ncbi:hypothetical protein [Pseudalkalibacillus caeni]|uniref:Uncharacterized protein n=1 Tax=Exobacillus caeni TaxID=2574798 RepID=A0A5R9F0B4_9BACL|nr:hypothetical protein [Pseudalkalibacillus caeni]TLS36451.1 hypothetical protein FCL54_14600 [Pseudalkalibacillus caeni]
MNDYMTTREFLTSNHFRSFDDNIQQLACFLLTRLSVNGMEYKIHKAKAKNRFSLWADHALDRSRNRDFLTIFVKKDELLLWPKLYGLSRKASEAEDLKKRYDTYSKLDEEFFDLASKAYKSICTADTSIKDLVIEKREKVQI